MKKFIKLSVYHFANLTENLKISILFILWVIFLVVTNIKKTDVNFINHSIVSGVILFYIMLVISNFYYYVEDEKIRNISALSYNNYPLYHLSDLVVLWVYGIIFSAIGIGVPMLLKRMGLLSYEQDVVNADIITAFKICVIFALLGVSVGSIFHPKVFKNRILEYILLVIVSISALAKDSIVKDKSFFKYLLWMIPPVSDIVGVFKGKKIFEAADINKTLIFFVIYFCAYSIINVSLVIKKRY